MQIGAQLWAFTTTLNEENQETILTRLRDAGYAFVEAMYNRPPQERAVFDRTGLPCYATHLALAQMPEGAALPDAMHQVGAGVACVSGLLQWNEREPDDYRRAADALNDWGARLRAEGLALHYHNHDFEFVPIEGATTGMELLLSGLDFGAVALCFDAGWAALAGRDPAAFIDERAEHIGTLHLRDFLGKTSVPLGAGELDLTEVVRRLPTLPALRAVLVEQDPPAETPLEDMEASRRFLQTQFAC